MAAGAIDVIAKPELGVKQFLADSAARIRDRRILPKLTADAVLAPPGGSGAMLRTTKGIVATGASTGGTEALRELLEAMPRDCRPIVIVQHMPETVTPAFARRLDSLCAITVTEARNGDRLLRGHALIGPGNRHTLLTRSGAIHQVEARDGPLVSRHKPSVDVLFRSVARNAVGAILTGMGDDGARGLKEMRDNGAATLGQNEASCVVYGMPKEAMQRGAGAQEMPLERIPAAILRLAR